MSYYQKKLPRRSIASEYLVPAYIADTRRKSYSVETIVPNKLEEDNVYNLGHSNHSSSEITFKTLNDSLNNLINSNTYYNARLASNRQMDPIEVEEQYSDEYFPIAIEVNNYKAPLNVISTESVISSQSSFEGKFDSNLIEMKTATVESYPDTDSVEEDDEEVVEKKVEEDVSLIKNLQDEIQMLKVNLESLRLELNELKIKQAKHESELESINDSNANYNKNQQKKILFLIKRLLDLEKDENEDYLDDNNISLDLIKDSTFRF